MSFGSLGFRTLRELDDCPENGAIVVPDTNCVLRLDPRWVDSAAISSDSSYFIIPYSVQRECTHKKDKIRQILTCGRGSLVDVESFSNPEFLKEREKVLPTLSLLIPKRMIHDFFYASPESVNRVVDMLNFFDLNKLSMRGDLKERDKRVRGYAQVALEVLRYRAKSYSYFPLEEEMFCRSFNDIFRESRNFYRDSFNEHFSNVVRGVSDLGDRGLSLEHFSSEKRSIRNHLLRDYCAAFLYVVTDALKIGLRSKTGMITGGARENVSDFLTNESTPSDTDFDVAAAPFWVPSLNGEVKRCSGGTVYVVSKDTDVRDMLYLRNCLA